MLLWISTTKAAELEQVNERTVRRNVYKYINRAIKGRGGKSGIQYEIRLDSLSEEAQTRYQTEQNKDDYSFILNIGDDQRDVAFYKQSVIFEYRHFWKTYAKADKQRAFLQKYNEEHTEKPITKRQLNHWERLYERGGLDGLVDRRGGYNRGMIDVDPEVRETFLAYWLREKGTKRGGPSVVSCRRLTQMALPDKAIPSISTFRRLANSVPLPTKVLAREGKKAFNDKCMPYTHFDVRSLHTNQQWVADTHTFDVLVLFPDGSVGRPYIIGWMDRRSRFIVGYLMTEKAPNSDDILDSFARTARRRGIPEGILKDNGSDYSVHDLFNRKVAYSMANKMVISVTSAIPYNAKAKPIERFFGTLEYSYCVHLDSYIGADPKRRPDDMKAISAKLKDKAMPYGEFVKFIDGVIEMYNGAVHTGEGMYGKTPQQSYQDNITVPIRVVNETLLSMYLKRTSRLLTVGRNGVRVPELEQYYNSDELFSHIGEKIHVRYNVDDVRQVYCVDESGKFLCIAESEELGVLDSEVTAQNMRKLNHSKKQRRKLAKAGIPDIKVPAFQQLVLASSIAQPEPETQEFPEIQIVNSEHQKQAEAMRRAEQKEKAKGEIDGRKKRSQREEDELYLKFMTGGAG